MNGRRPQTGLLDGVDGKAETPASRWLGGFFGGVPFVIEQGDGETVKLGIR
jgi:hypothetical protein